MSAVKDFMPVGDAKITTEKEVKQKPTIEELTTVETPGRPSPANLLEERPNRTKAPRKKPAKPKSTPSRVIKRDGVLIITEKPQAAQKIADALGDARKYTESGVSYFELERNGKKIYVASAVGHLFGLDYIKGQKGWPIFDIQWEPAYKKKNSAFTKRYYDLIKHLSLRVNEYVVATDFDVEGEVIGWNVLRFICNQKDAKRMKFSTLTKAELEKAYDKPLKELNWGNAYAGESRHILDWMYGINLSRALMSAIKTTGSFKILSIGRVQGPALKIIVDREIEIENFKPEPFWRIFAIVQGISLQHPEDIFNKKEVDKFKKLKEGIATTTKTEERISPPVPFDLTTLQREAYNLYKISPSQTLAIAQKLYLDGVISYPRTSSQKIPTEIEPKKILKKLEKQFPEAKNATRPTPIEGKKSDPAHPSIYPTGDIPKSLEEQSERLYNLIAKRFIAAFSADAVTANKKISLDSNGLIFSTTGYTILEKGWAAFYPTRMEETNLPDINGKVKIDEIKIEEKETQPPRRYTPASLITTLEKKNLGTKATRSTIVDTLFDRGYLDGTSIKATALGMRLIKSLQKYSPIIIDENLTRKLEDEMEKMQDTENSGSVENSLDRDSVAKNNKTNRMLYSKENLVKQEADVIENAKEIITKISEEFKAKETAIGKELMEGVETQRAEQRIANELMVCPTCKEGKLRILYSKKTRKYFVACSKYPDCKQTYPLPPNALIKKSEKVSEDGLPMLIAIRKGKRPWEFKFDPNWRANNPDYVSKATEVPAKEDTKEDVKETTNEDSKEDKDESIDEDKK